MTELSENVREWWSRKPMTYARTHGSTDFGDSEPSLGDRAFFDQVDAQFLEWNRPLHGERAFEKIFPYDDLRGMPVLEIGCGLGTMAMNWAIQGARVTAIDLSQTAVKQTRERFRIFGLQGEISQSDAVNLPFADESFQYVFSWGVLHHSPNIGKSMAELMRVLKGGGRYGIMVYNRHSLYHRYLTRFVEGFLHMESRFLNPLDLASRYGDGGQEEGNPFTWPMTRAEMLNLLTAKSSDAAVRVLGTDLDYVLSPMLPGIGPILPTWIKKVWARRFGWSLWLHGTKN